MPIPCMPPAHTTIDDALMESLRSPEGAQRERALRELIVRHGAALTRALGFLISDPATVDDLVQETFLRVFQARDRYISGAASFRTWSRRIARNLALDHLRQQARRGRSPRAAPPTVDSDLGPLPTLLGQQRAEQVREVVAELPPAERELILLRFEEELSYEAIAEVTGLTQSTIESRLFRARGKLRVLLAQRFGAQD